ncbi:hypothetical protein BGW36DRAFT_156407 [Talaromyces proteolyticus]|uniref:Calcium-transporting ATPase n=1 Tax=Talaromyces proteolyticus TaxID=1131652 RepID=A0AAD4KS88_9EURO|nr:uncharacterized protein BGW36DRAFT_156407 [Talaromyces proteolyticus]KAH8699199.1 hypothetical protein BGW36DRAFT_156407 [Talaromyces proteolyticus]
MDAPESIIDTKLAFSQAPKATNHQFGCTPKQLQHLAESRDLSALQTLGGLAGLETSLLTDRKSGLSPDEFIREDATPLTDYEKRLPTLSTEKTVFKPPFDARRRIFGDNRLPTKREPPFWQLMWMAYNDYVLFLLTGAAIISLGLGLYQALGTPRTPNNPPIEWVEGVAILVAIVIIVLVGALNDFQKQYQFRKLNKKQQDRNVKVIRSGRPQEILIHDVVVGDIVQIEPGDVIPADGILIQGLLLRCDESSMTGESNLRPKCPADDAVQASYSGNSNTQVTTKLDPFIISGTKVAEGVGSFLIIATGRNSAYGTILQRLEDEPTPTPLQMKLGGLAKSIAICGGVVALIFFVILFIKFLVELPHSTRSPAEKGQLFLNIFIIALTVVVIAVPEGLPLAVTLSLAFATTRMLKDRNLVRSLRACETMGNATSICSDKTGTLTQNRMTVVAGAFGTNSKYTEGASSSITEYIRGLSFDVRSILKSSIVINSTAFESDDSSYIGSRTESALLTLARDAIGMGPVEVERSDARVVYLVPFDSSRKCMVSVVRLDNGVHRAYIKGASEILLRACNTALENPEAGLSPIPVSDDIMQNLQDIISKYARHSWRTMTLAYRDFHEWPPVTNADPISDVGHIVPLDEILRDLTFLAIMGIQDPLRDGVPDAIQTCAKAGVTVRMVTGDNLLTAKAIAEEAGILTDHEDIAIEASEFRTLQQSQQIEMIPHLKVLARSTPEDKRILVMRLKQMGEIVAVTGDGTNDVAALMAADIGFSMGISGTEVAREASSIVLMDDNFTSIVKAIMWGRAVNDAVSKFLQFQITITITSVGLTFVSAVANGNQQSVLTAVQLMWINLFQDTMAALALATDPPSSKILDRKPVAQSAPLITLQMWKMIIGQSIYQMAVTLVLYFAGSSIFHYHTSQEKAQLQTAIFNTYVWLQIFNMFK